jgi:hypothetical protein
MVMTTLAVAALMFKPLKILLTLVKTVPVPISVNVAVGEGVTAAVSGVKIVW